MHLGMILLFTLSCIAIQGFFAMFEMACVSFNKVRFQYYASKKNKKILWMHSLLTHPSRLFGTTLLLTSTFMQIGSEASRHLYQNLGLNPDLAPLSQVFLVLIFGELAPLFAARKHPETIALFCTPPVYILSKILFPFTFLLEALSKGFSRFFGSSNKESPFFLSREEIQKAFEQENSPQTLDQTMTTVLSHIFTLKDLTARQLMMPFSTISPVFCESTLEQLEEKFTKKLPPFIPLYRESPEQILAIFYSQNSLFLSKEKPLLSYSQSPWFISETTSILQILKEFQQNHQTLAIILNSFGKVLGYLTFEQILDEIFGETFFPVSSKELKTEKILIDKTFPGDLLLAEFNQQFHTKLKYKKAKTLSDLISSILKHPPTEGETIYIDDFELTVLEPSLLGAKIVRVKTFQH